jgi:hypothetical protein
VERQVATQAKNKVLCGFDKSNEGPEAGLGGQDGVIKREIGQETETEVRSHVQGWPCLVSMEPWWLAHEGTCSSFRPG